MEFNSIPFINSIHSLHHLFSSFASLYQHPLFSTILTLYTLILLYVPSLFFTILLSPVLNSTGIILLSLLRLGANEKLQQQSTSQELEIIDCSDQRLENVSTYLESRDLDHQDEYQTSNSSYTLALEYGSTESRFLDFVDQTETHKQESNLITGSGVACHLDFEPEYGLDMECNQRHVEVKHDMRLESNSKESYKVIQGKDHPKQVDTTTMAFLEWNMRAPLEIIYEAYEGEEEDDDDEENNENKQDFGNKVAMDCERYPSPSMYYSDSETNSSSDDDFPMNEKWETYESVFFKWEKEEEEEEREELIEISLDRHGKRSIEICHSEEDNLIEINIFPTRN